jgi:hypothetical protein
MGEWTFILLDHGRDPLVGESAARKDDLRSPAQCA